MIEVIYNKIISKQIHESMRKWDSLVIWQKTISLNLRQNRMALLMSHGLTLKSTRTVHYKSIVGVVDVFFTGAGSGASFFQISR